jgi:hypothetical protein
MVFVEHGLRVICFRELRAVVNQAVESAMTAW